MSDTDKVAKVTPSALEERLNEVKQILPEIFTEDKLDVSKLRQVLGENIEENTERYHFTWAGRQDATMLLQTPSRATLVPDYEESVNFDTTDNIFIEGDNFEVLKLLSEPYAGSVKAIYIDPPYNTGGDFVYQDDYKDPLNVYLQLTGQKDEEGNRLTTNVETSGRYHSAWLSMMYPRLFLSRQLLCSDGIIFVSIDDHEVYNLRMVMNEVFGPENFIGGFVWRKKVGAGSDSKLFYRQHEHILMFARNISQIKQLFQPLTEKQKQEYENPDNDPRGPWAKTDLNRTGDNDPNRIYEVVSPTGKSFTYCWTYTEQNFQKLIDDNRIWWGKTGNAKPKKKRFLKEKDGLTPRSWVDIALTSDGTNDLKKLGLSVFEYPKPVELIKHFLLIATKENDCILDFFAGSCSTAQAVLELNKKDGGNRQFIMVQLPEPTAEKSEARQQGYETIADIGKERIRRVITKLQEDNGEDCRDLGMKIFRLSESNYQSWNGVNADDTDTYTEQMQLFLDNPFVKGYTPENVIYEVALKQGYPLNSLIEQVDGLQQNTIFRVTTVDNEQEFYICLDEELYQNDIDALGLTNKDVFVCLDNAINDTRAANLALQCRLQTI